MTSGDFWTRRRAAVEAEEAAVQRAEALALEARQEAALAEQSDAELLAALDLPEPESLGQGGDFKRFLQEQVPQGLRNRALRHLWRLDPVLANLDGLVDYGEDFTDAATVPEGLQTAYQVGRGMTRHVEALARQDPARNDVTLNDLAQNEPPKNDLAQNDLLEEAASSREIARQDLPISASLGEAAPLPQASAKEGAQPLTSQESPCGQRRLAAAQEAAKQDIVTPALQAHQNGPRRMRFDFTQAPER